MPYTLPEGKFADAFHTFELEWNAQQLIWRVDHNTVATMDISPAALSEFQKEFFILFNLAVGGTYAGRPDNTTVFPQFMYVDWVRVYQQK